MKISEIQAKDKKPFRAYFNRVPIWWKYHERTQAIFDYANERYYQLPSKRLAYDNYIRKISGAGLLQKNDLRHIYCGDGDVNFRLINVANPGVYNGEAYGGLQWLPEGVKGNAVNGVITTGFAPRHTPEGINYKLLDASKFFVGEQGVVNPTAGLIGRDNRFGPAGTRVLIRMDNSVYKGVNGECTQLVNFTGVGFRSVSRRSTEALETVAGDLFREVNAPVNEYMDASHLLFSESFNVDTGVGSRIGSHLVYMVAMGSSITYEETQLERQFFNEYLVDLGLEPIA